MNRNERPFSVWKDFFGPDGAGPRVKDRYVYRDKAAEVVAVTERDVVVEVTTPDACFRKSVTLDQFPTLEHRTLKMGAVFKPAPNAP